VKTFRALVVLKRPQDELWTNMRDHLVHFAGEIADIEGIRQLERSEDGDGVVRIANEWRARQQIPTSIRALLNVTELTWIDRNAWDITSCTCTWTIEPGFLQEFITCRGETTFAPAMGGRGTRVTFSGELDLQPGVLGGRSNLEGMLNNFVEPIVSSIIPRNLRAVVEAAAAYEP
jgi:hypothetical protein